MGGWIKLHRKLCKWEWYDDHNTTRLFIHLLLKAQHEDSQYRGVDIKKGSMKTGRIQLASETGLSQQQVRTSLKKLISTNEITIKTTNKYSIIAVNNWGDHQIDNQQNTQQVTNNQPTNNQQVTTCKNDKKEKNGKTKIDLCAEPVPDSTPEKAILEFPTTGNPKSWLLTEPKLKEYSETYDTLDVLFQCKKARQWILDNPSRKKTAGGMTRFLNGWFNRAVSNNDTKTSEKESIDLSEYGL